jgi:hypothetical protein
MPKPNKASFLESQILAQLGELDRRIAHLVAERDALQRVYVKVHNQSVGANLGARRNSYDRLLVERTILAALNAAKKHSLTARALFREARAVSPGLKDATFRSYLHRLKERSIVIPVDGIRGYWKLPEKPQIANSGPNAT